MIVDTSVLMAILREEPEADAFAKHLAQASYIGLSAGSWLELAAVTTRGGGNDLFRRSEELVADTAAVILPVTIEQARIARDAYRRFGRGTGHPARLNYGDCFAYALAIATGAPLLFKGDDFSRTDVVAAL